MSTEGTVPPETAIALLRDRFINHPERIGILAPWGKPCPLAENGDLEALLTAHVLGPEVNPVRLKCKTRRGPVSLEGHFRVGAYTPAPDQTSRWICIDFDGLGHAEPLADPLAAALEVYRAFEREGLPVYLERSGGGYGWHDWLFFDPAVSAATARALALMLLAPNIPLAGGGCADSTQGRGIEVFPKQDRIRGSGYGNLTWLPFWHAAPPRANQFYQPLDSGAIELIVPAELRVAVPADLDRILGSSHDNQARSGSGSEKKRATDSPWKQWRVRALADLPLDAVYGAWLTGRPSGAGWLECRDPDSPSGDQHPSAGVADCVEGVERGSFHSFHSERTISVFDFLIEQELVHSFFGAQKRVAELSGIALPGMDGGSKDFPLIQKNDRQLRDLTTDAWRALHGMNRRPDLFQRGGVLVRIAGRAEFPQIRLVGADEIYGLLARAANWVIVTRGGLVNTSPSSDVACDMLVYPDPDVPHLEAIAFAPLFDSEGNLLAATGYHPKAKTWIHRDPGARVEEVAAAPLADMVDEARRLLLNELLVDFPFEADSDRAHAVAALILTFVRRMIPGPTPIHLIESPTPGTGKGLLAEVISLIATGRPSSTTTLPRDEDEVRKKITSVLLRGQEILLLDNVRGGLESSPIAAAITAEVWSDRILRESRMVDLPNQATWIVTANNPSLSLEIARRCVRVRLDPKVDRPWQRTDFKHPKLGEWVRENRGRLIWAILVIVRAWIAAGRPPGSRSLGSFERWAATIGGILEHAEVGGLLQDTELLYTQADAEGQAWRAFTITWWERFQDGWVSASELHSLAVEKDLLVQVLGEKGDRSQKIRLGKALQSVRDRRFGPYRVVSEPNTTTGASRYRLDRVSNTGGETSESKPSSPTGPSQGSQIDLADVADPNRER